MNFAGKVVLVTGGSRGIGRGIAVEFAKRNAIVIITYRKEVKSAEETVRRIQAAGGYGTAIKADVSEYSVVHLLVSEVISKFGRLDILVNNAGISKSGLFIDMNTEDWQQVMDTNLKGVFNCCHNVVPYMLKWKKGCIINISSIWGNVGAACEVIYSASKGGINAFTKALAKELAPSNIRVNAISPGVIDTDMNAWLSEEEAGVLKDEIPLNRFGSIEEIGKVACFLAAEESSYITGQIITVDGGML